MLRYLIKDIGSSVASVRVLSGPLLAQVAGQAESQMHPHHFPPTP